MSGIWPGSTKCAVFLTFDLDGISALLNRDPELINRPSMVSRNEFGLNVGAMRILDVLDKYGLPATFFIPGYTADKVLLRTSAKPNDQVTGYARAVRKRTIRQTLICPCLIDEPSKAIDLLNFEPRNLGDARADNSCICVDEAKCI